jgi:hypothetical protein
MDKYLIDYSGWSDEGGYCQVYPIKDKRGWVFKEFRNKRKAQESYKYHKLLAGLDLAPKIYSKIIKLEFAEDDGYKPDEPSDWGYITERAYPVKHTDSSMRKIQSLVEIIQDKTGLKFWDCHWFNVGLVLRADKKKLVCIDTGKESFSGISNAWGMSEPGPKCCYCEEYQCKCSED